jgi:hypothetical protein
MSLLANFLQKKRTCGEGSEVAMVMLRSWHLILNFKRDGFDHF